MSLATFADGRIMLEIGEIARLRLNRPEKRNAVSRLMWRGLSDACDRISMSSEIRVVVIDGIGPHFCAGADISEFVEAYSSDESAERYNAEYRAVEAAIRNLAVPVIACIRGACFGGGLGIALSADFRFADQSVKVAITASRLGIAYSAEDSARLMEKIGPVRAKDMLFSSRTISAHEALSWGLIDRLVYEEDELSGVVDAYADPLAARSRHSLKAMKTIVNTLAEPDGATCSTLRPVYSDLFRGDDLVEGSLAFLEKREPVFR